MEKLSLIDVSSEDDNLIFSPSTSFVFPISFDQADDSSDESFVGISHSQGTNEDTCGKSHIPSWSLESNREMKVSGCKYNLRKSIAWDSAFFTNEGVLNREELSVLNKTFRKPERHDLIETSEDDQGSAESGTARNESLVLEDLELDLFKQLITSKQSDGDESSNTSCFPSNANSRTTLIEYSFARKSNLDGDTQVKKSPNPKSCGASRQKFEKNPRDSDESMKSCRKDCTSSVKPPKTLAKVSTPPVSAAPEKKIFVSSKSLNAPQKASQGSHALMLPTLRSSPRYLSSGKTKISGSGSSLGRSSSISCDKSGNMSANRTRTKKETRHAILSAYVSSNSNLYQSISPAKSVDGMSSDSSSSTCSFRSSQRWKGISRLSSHSFTGKTRIYGSHLCNMRTSTASISSRINTALPVAKDDSSTICTEPANSPSNSSISEVDHTKSSWLRRPSPKIGFFDEATNPQGKCLSGLPLKVSAHKSPMNNSGSRSIPRSAPGLCGSDKWKKSQVIKIRPTGSVQHTGNPHLQLQASVSPSSSNTRSSVSHVTSCAKSLESCPSISKIQKPSSIKISKKSSPRHLSGSSDHNQVSEGGSKYLSPPSGMTRDSEKSQAQSTITRRVRAGENQDKCCDEENHNDNDEKIASSSSSENQAFSDNAEQHDLQEDHVKNQTTICDNPKAGKGSGEQVYENLDLSSVCSIKVENRPNRRSPLTIKHNNEPVSLEFKDKAVVEGRHGQENIVSETSCKEVLKDVQVQCDDRPNFPTG